VTVSHDISDGPVDPDLLVLEEGLEDMAAVDSEFPPEPVESYVPPYIPDPPPEARAKDRVRTYEEKAPPWFRILVLLAVALVITAVGAVLHNQGTLEEWATRLTPPAQDAEEIAAAEPAPNETDPIRPGPVTEPNTDPVKPDPVVTGPPIRTNGKAKPFPKPGPIDRKLPDPRGELDAAFPPIVVETSGKRKITLLAGEILVELRNGNFLKGRLHKITDKALRLVMDGGYVDVELSRLRASEGEGDAPYKSVKTYPRVRVCLVTGEVLTGRLLKSDDEQVELVFLSGKVAFRRDMVRRMMRL
jgi:small nuclear ribonucleoprotein (snRNP)-like protein